MCCVITSEFLTSGSGRTGPDSRVGVERVKGLETESDGILSVLDRHDSLFVGGITEVDVVHLSGRLLSIDFFTLSNCSL